MSICPACPTASTPSSFLSPFSIRLVLLPATLGIVFLYQFLIHVLTIVEQLISCWNCPFTLIATPTILIDAYDMYKLKNYDMKLLSKGA